MNIFQFKYHSKDILLDLPYKEDYIMKYIMEKKIFWEDWILSKLYSYLDNNRYCCIDIGANIGNHSIYFSEFLNYNIIYSFEPQKDIYDILLNNIKLNSLDKKIIPYMIGLYSKRCRCKIDNRVKNNCGCVSFKEDPNGDYEFKTLDEYNFTDVGLIKIDVEGLSYDVLCGCKNTLENNNPLIWIEMNSSEYYSKIAYKEFVLPTNFLLEHKYSLVRKFGNSDYIFKRI